MSKGAWMGRNLNEIQSLVDELAHDLGRPVAVDDPSFGLVCASAQTGAIDERRIAAIISRSSPPEPVPWLLSHGIEDAAGPVRLPANPEFRMLPRVCFPIRHHGELHAYLWLFDDPRVGDEEIERTGKVVDRLAALLVGDGRDATDRAKAARRHAADLLAGVEGAVAHAHSDGYLPGDGTLTVHLVRLHDADEDLPPMPGALPGPMPGRMPQRLHDELSKNRTSRPLLSIDSPGAVIVIGRSRSAADSRRTVAEIRRAATASAARIESIGSAGADPPGMIDRALSRARFTADLALLLGPDPGSLTWDDAGAWRLLLGWSLEESTVHAISDDARRLLSSGAQSHWRTVLAYLDNARNTTATSKQLFIHRATLHYRLERVRDVLGEDALDDGWRVTATHVALRLHAALDALAGRRPNT